MRRMTRLLLDITIAVLVIIVLSFNNQENNKFDVTLKDCVDGDTAKFITPNGVETVRFLAIDTPETVHPTKGVQPFGKEASNYTCNALKTANSIALEVDSNSDEYDKYDRLLAWVFVDNQLLQSKLVVQGYAKVAYLYGNYKYTNILLAEEDNAQSNKVGMWYNY